MMHDEGRSGDAQQDAAEAGCTAGAASSADYVGDFDVAMGGLDECGSSAGLGFAAGEDPTCAQPRSRWAGRQSRKARRRAARLAAAGPRGAEGLNAQQRCPAAPPPPPTCLGGLSGDVASSAAGCAAAAASDFDLDDGGDGFDYTMVEVPPEAVGVATGPAADAAEMDWCVELDVRRDRDGNVFLAICGGIRERRGAELSLLGAIEAVVPGNFMAVLDGIIDKDRRGDSTGIWGTDLCTLTDAELPHLLDGDSLRSELGATGAVVALVGNALVSAGTQPQRRRAKDALRRLYA